MARAANDLVRRGEQCNYLSHGKVQNPINEGDDDQRQCLF